MAAVERWISDPDESGRRAAWSAGEAADERSPERLLSYAVFLSGGSIAPEDQAVVNPAPELSGRLAAAAVITAAYLAEQPDEHLSAALAAGEAIARGDG